MTLSRRTLFWSEIQDLDAHIPREKLEYLSERFRNDLYDFIIRKFIEQREERGLNQAQLARRLAYDPARLNRLLGAPGNWTLGTVSDLLVGISGESLDLQASTVQGNSPRNLNAHDLLQSETGLTIEKRQAEPVGTGSVTTIKTAHVQ